MQAFGADREPILELKDETFARFQSLMRELTGVHLADNKKQLVFSRLRMRLRDLGLHNFERYEEKLKGLNGQHERQVFIDLLTTHETYFFRETPHFEFLKKMLGPPLPPDAPFRVWSAACSTGEEPYSIAMVLADRLGLGANARWEVVGSDVSEPAVQRALEGIYPDQRMDGIPPNYRKQFMQTIEDRSQKKLAVHPALKSKVKFRVVNLNAELPALGLFDVIFLRNMLIYFEAQSKVSIVKRLLKVLRPNGYLFTGHTEYLRDVDPRVVPLAPAIYQFLPDKVD